MHLNKSQINKRAFFSSNNMYVHLHFGDILECGFDGCPKRSACLGADVEECDPSVQDAPEHLVAPGFHLGDARVEPLHLLQRGELPVLVGGGGFAAPGDQGHERRRRRRFLGGGGRRGGGGSGGGRDGLEGGEHGRGRGRRGAQGLGEHPGHLDLGGGGRWQWQPAAGGGGCARGRREAGEALLGAARRADGRREARRVAAAQRGLGLGGVAPEVDQRLPERAVRVGQRQEAVQEAVREGGGAGGGERGAGLREDEELGERGVERGEVGEARGRGGGGGAGVGGGGGGGPGAGGAGCGVEVGEQRVRAAGRETDGAHVARLLRGGGGACRAQREGDGAAEGGRHGDGWTAGASCLACSALVVERPRRMRGVYKAEAPAS
jgi:hypothetical protein